MTPGKGSHRLIEGVIKFAIPLSGLSKACVTKRRPAIKKKRKAKAKKVPVKLRRPIKKKK
jgi:hypothetical protein